ncbi:unnamed protein product [Onchocerca ochengi]|uniref:Uncharacterized protein n=1 Tax=Onchocerca ochengi TaxID=42157 RepID=A0A182ED90_ONCOC|nr:unnamed protein product [Onchocerca ochengi]
MDSSTNLLGLITPTLSTDSSLRAFSLALKTSRYHRFLLDLIEYYLIQSQQEYLISRYIYCKSYLLYKLICYRNIEPQSHRPTLHSVRTHPAAPLPLMSTYTAAPGQLQVASVAHAGLPQMFPYAHAICIWRCHAGSLQNTGCAATIITTANVTNGPVIANTAGLLIDYHEQINSLMKSIATIYARFLYCVCS